MRLSSGWGTTGAVIAAAILALATTDRFLADVQAAELRASARQDYLKGCSLLEHAEAGAAISFLSDAHALERDNTDYELQLAAALATDGKRSLAEPMLQDVLQREPNSGPANLIAARWMSQLGTIAGAEAHYHRAIYGEWPGGQDSRRLAARTELIDLMARNGQKQELIGELISLEAVAPPGAALQKRLATLFLNADAPSRAAAIYSRLIATDPSDVAAYEGLGEAELQQGEYRAASQAFFRALLRDPRNSLLRQRFLTLTAVTGLDPTPRQLTSAEKYRRSVRLLSLTRAALDQCGTLSSASAVTAPVTPPAHATNEMAEEVLDQAVGIWQSRPQACRVRASDETLALVMKKLAS